MKDEPKFSIQNDEKTALYGCEDGDIKPLPESQNKDQEIVQEKNEMRPKPRILSIQSTSSGNLLSSHNCVS